MPHKHVWRSTIKLASFFGFGEEGGLGVSTFSTGVAAFFAGVAGFAAGVAGFLAGVAGFDAGVVLMQE